MKSVPTLLLITLISLPLATELLAQRSDGSSSASAERPSGGRAGRRGARLAGSSSADYSSQSNVIARIKDEGLNHSEVMKTLSYLSDVIGPRLTGSPNLKRANEWTRDQLTSWGLTNAHLEAWGPFGRGWTLKRFSAQVIEPQDIPLIAYPNAWSPGFDQPITADVVYLDARSTADLDQYKGKLRGAIVLSGAPRDLKPWWEPMARRLEETNLLQLANAGERSSSLSGFGVVREGQGGGGFGRRFLSSTNSDESTTNSNTTSTGAGASTSRSTAPGGTRGGRFRGQSRFLSFLAKEGAALVVTPSSQGDGGTFFVSAANVPIADTNSGFGGGFGSLSNAPRAWSTNAPEIPPQMTVAVEHYNRLVRMIQQGEKLKMAVDLKVEFNDQDPMAYNTIAEIPGTDLKNEIVMLGGHLDSWHSGTGATDNGAGVAATMEAARILKALHLEPRRTIRIGLWTGEEEGLLGSKAYVAKHFGYYTNGAAAAVVERARSPKDESGDGSSPTAIAVTTVSALTNSEPRRSLIRQREYEKLSVYFNLDNGAGKIRGVYMQNNEAVRPLFRHWLEPFSDLGAQTLTLANTGGTDHLSFDGIGLPGFEFMQDPLEYNSRTHHSNQDVFDRAPAEDLKQAATIIAAFVYDAAMADQPIPRKPLPGAMNYVEAR
jgi:carboxypeptidase Q